MTDFFTSPKTPLWYREQGPESDVVISSRLRLARNLSSLLYPHLLQEEGLKSVRLRIEESLRTLGCRERFVLFDFEDLTETEASYLSEEGRGDRGSLGARISVFCRDDGRLNLVLNDEDHLRITAIRGGALSRRDLGGSGRTGFPDGSLPRLRGLARMGLPFLES